jgi:hypothetical protein
METNEAALSVELKSCTESMLWGEIPLAVAQICEIPSDTYARDRKNISYPLLNSAAVYTLLGTP